MVDAVLADELQRAISVVSLEHSDDSLGQRDTQTVFESILELNFIARLQTSLRIAA